MSYCNILAYQIVSPKILQFGKLIIYNNQLYFGNSSNVPTQVTPSSISASNITSGTLSSDRLPTVPITKGGTNATSASTALSNLGGFPKTGGTISGAVNITGKLDVQNTAMHIGFGNSGAKLNFGDGNYVYLYENPDDTLVIYADKGIHLQCGSNSSYDITAQHGTDTAISLLGGGSSGKVVAGTFSYSGSDKSVNVGFEPVLVLMTSGQSSLQIGTVSSQGAEICANNGWKYDSISSYIYSNGFYLRTDVVTANITVAYAAFG